MSGNNQGVLDDRLRKGAGSLNGKGAIDLAMRYDASASGRLWLTSMSSPWTTIGGVSQTWNQGVI